MKYNIPENCPFCNVKLTNIINKTIVINTSVKTLLCDNENCKIGSFERYYIHFDIYGEIEEVGIVINLFNKNYSYCYYNNNVIID